MSGPVGVLAVLADYSAQHGDPEDFEQARAAVAELIEALEQAFDFPPDFFDRPDDELEQITVSGRHLRMVRAALARCRGEA